MFIIMDVREGNFSKKVYFQEEKDWWRILPRIAQVNFLLMPVFRINSFSMMNKKVA